ncbi:DNA photolyase phr1, partial [Mortierella sp. GBA43]
IDWDRVQIEQHKDAPTLKLNLEGVSEAAIPFTAVMAIMDFLHDFETHYVDLYTRTLFEHLAWRYMSKALKPADLHHQYEDAIKAVDEKARTWAKVEEVLRHDIFKLPVMQSEILRELFDTTLKTGEVAETYVHRIESFYRAAGIPGLDKAVITKVVASLPDDGREKVIDHFKKFQDITSLKALMAFIRANPSVVLGTRSNPFAWIKEKFGKKKSNNQPNNLAQRSQEAELSNKKPFQPRGGAIRNRNGPTNNRQRSAPYKGQRDQTGRFSSQKNTGNTCQYPVCKLFERKHTEAQCVRHTDKAKFEEMNKSQAGKPSDSKRVHRPQGRPTDKVASIRQTPTGPAQEDYIPDPLGNSMEYNEDDLLSDYPECPKSTTLSAEKANTRTKPQLILYPKEAIYQKPRYLITSPNYASSLPLNRLCAVKATNRPVSPLANRRMGLKRPESSDNRVFVPIKIQGEDYTALLDPGSTHSYLDKAIAKELGIKCSVLPDQAVELGEAGNLTNKVITDERITLICNGRTVEWQSSVIDQKYYDFLIGMDLFPRFGYRIEGFHIPIHPRNDVYVVEAKPAIVPEDPIATEQEPSFVRRREIFLQRIDDALQRNGQIDPKSHCPLDIMRVELKVKDGCTIQQGSRRFYTQTENNEVDTTVKKWIDNGIIVPAPKGNPYNNSLTLAARKNLEGVILKYRVCLDPRKLNKQLAETDNFPLPIINDILEKVSGHKYLPP